MVVTTERNSVPLSMMLSSSERTLLGFFMIVSAWVINKDTLGVCPVGCRECIRFFYIHIHIYIFACVHKVFSAHLYAYTLISFDQECVTALGLMHIRGCVIRTF